MTDAFRTSDKQSFVTYERSGAVSVDLKAYLQTPEGKAQLDALKPLKARRSHRCLRCGAGNEWIE